jgi:hypothetical protein
MHPRRLSPDGDAGGAFQRKFRSAGRVRLCPDPATHPRIAALILSQLLRDARPQALEFSYEWRDRRFDFGFSKASRYVLRTIPIEGRDRNDDRTLYASLVVFYPK